MTRTKLMACAMIVLIAGSVFGEERPAAPLPLAAKGRGWELRPEFSDEFNGAALDLTKWDNDVASWGIWSWSPDNVRVENGLLKLRMQYQEHDRKGKKLYYTSGAIKSKAPPIKFGYFEARLKTAPLFPGVSPAFWLYRTEADIWTEMDWELTQAATVQLNGANTFVFRHPKLNDDKKLEGKKPKLGEVVNFDTKCDPRKDFHVYGIEWDETEIRWYFDGKLARTRKNEYWDQPLDLILSLGLRHPYAKTPGTKGFPTEYEVDYVRVWRRTGEGN